MKPQLLNVTNILRLLSRLVLMLAAGRIDFQHEYEKGLM